MSRSSSAVLVGVCVVLLLTGLGLGAATLRAAKEARAVTAVPASVGGCRERPRSPVRALLSVVADQVGLDSAQRDEIGNLVPDAMRRTLW